MRKFFILSSLFIAPLLLNAQSTFSDVATLLNVKCGNLGCHATLTQQGALDLSGSAQDIYSEIVNQDPYNVTAKNKGDKLISPGYPEKSFLLRKLIHNLDNSTPLESGEGSPMPSGSNLTKPEVELIRQWVLAGARDTGNVIDQQMIADFYNGGGLPRIDPIEPPDPSEGIQIHVGPIFLHPGEEVEYLKKHDLELTEGIEVTQISNGMNDQSHHLILYKYNLGAESSNKDGLRKVTRVLDLGDIFLNSFPFATWQFARDHKLPEGTAYKWSAGTVLDVNYHLKNYDQNKILAADVYLNFLYQDEGTADLEMHASLSIYGGFSPFALNVPATGQPYSIEMNQTGGNNDSIHVWLLQAHTHKLGIDYNIFRRNGDGTRGGQVYDGTFDYSNGFDTGVYDYEHPPVREFIPFLGVDMNEGLIHEATYLNSTGQDVGFGLTTADEMFITYYQYTLSPLKTGIRTTARLETNNWVAYPNPVSGNLILDLTASNIESDYNVKVTDMAGKQLMNFNNLIGGRQIIDMSKLMPGIYFVQLEVVGVFSTKKIIKQ